MKSFTLTALSSLVTIISASPDHFQSVPSILCTDVPPVTITVIEQCASLQTTAATRSTSEGAGPTTVSGSSQGAVVTVTATITDTFTVTQTAIVTDLAISSSSQSASEIITFTSDVTSSTTTTAALSKKTHDILVGAFVDGNGTDFLFKPNNITADVGDIVRFNMLGKAHSVTQSQFARPCIHNGSFDTQLQPNDKNVTGIIFEEFEVNVATPLWFYCKQTLAVSHCGKGMVFGINPKSQLQMEMFIQMAEAQNGTFKGSSSVPTTSTTEQLSAPTALVKRPKIKGRSARLF
ncbi:hypothetical protein MMC34_006348 [Xylographa carneopallida]|nr:hypothetical protein [Xylographa carneopallida]